MASYIESCLINGENVVYEGKISFWSLLPLLLIGLFTLGFFGVGIIFWIVAAVRFFSTELAITNKRVMAKFGFISRKTIEIDVKKIETIQVSQGVFGRIFNFGSIIVSGAGNPQTPIPGISNPLNFRRKFLSTHDQTL